MPNQVHSLIYISKGRENLNQLVANGKRFMAYEIIKRLKELGQEDVLSVLRAGVQKNVHTKGKKHKVFRLSFDAKVCFDEHIIVQKLEYMHANLVSGKWNLVEVYIEYEHSSARFYENDQEHKYCNVLHFRD